MSAWTKYGTSLYLLLLHANFLDEPADLRQAFTMRFLDAVTSLRDRHLTSWINSAWREQLTAAWIIAARCEVAFRDQVTGKLLASGTYYAGQGLCLATARYGDYLASDTLTAYLEYYLPVRDREYDQKWAVGSLVWLDARLGTNRAQRFLDAPDLWKVTACGQERGALDPRCEIERVARAMAFLDNLFLEETG